LFTGTMPPPLKTQGESFNLNIACGGEATVIGNTFVKTASRDNSYGITYNDGRCHTYTDHPEWLGDKFIDYQNNTFVTLAQGYDGTPISRRNIPMGWLSNARQWVLPGDEGFPATIKA